MEIRRLEEQGMTRNVLVQRNTKETKITMSFESGRNRKSQPEYRHRNFFDHMLDGFARHGFFDLDLAVDGDLNVDSHHTIEDTGIVLGTAIKEALGDKAGIRRYGSMILPMDETLVLCGIDLSGRPYLNFDGEFTAERLGDMDTEMAREFFYAVSYAAGMNLHIKVLDGTNNHHIMEAMFKAFAKALDQAVSYNPKVTDVLSTKGSL